MDLAWTLFHLGETDEAIKRLNQFQDVLDDSLKSNSTLAYIYARMGMQEELNNCIDKAFEERKR